MHVIGHAAHSERDRFKTTDNATHIGVKVRSPFTANCRSPITSCEDYMNV